MSRFGICSANHSRRHRLIGLESLERRTLLDGATSDDDAHTVVYDLASHTEQRIPLNHVAASLAGSPATSGEAGGVRILANASGLVAASPGAPRSGRVDLPAGHSDANQQHESVSQ